MIGHLWFTADLHFGHVNIIDFSGRPFASVDEMNEGIIDGWNEQVGIDDEVWVLGDFAMGKISDTLPLVQYLKGIKKLRTGNHDRCFSGHGSKADGWEEKYLDAGFVEVVHGYDWSKDVGAVVSHFPYAGDSGAEDRYVDERPPDKGAWLVHGHVHDKWRQRGRMINIGIDAWGGRLVSQHEILKLIHDGPQDLPRIDWRLEATRRAFQDG